MADKKKKGFSLKEKLAHFTAVAKGEKATKSGSKFSDAEQRAYARGQRDARNESHVIHALKNSTPEQQKAFAASKKQKRGNK
jgi:hypothetical protein